MARILILDGDPDVVEAGMTILQREGYTVATAPNVEGALALFDHFRPDLLFIDVLARHLEDAVVMARQVRDHGWHLPILVLATLDRSVEFFTYGDDGAISPAVEFTQKPMEPTALVKNVRHLLSVKSDGDSDTVQR